MKKHYFWAFMLLAPAAIVSCSDVNLNDIDTSVSVQVHDLTLPVNLDQVKLGTMLDVNDDSMIKVINGEYAVVIDGTFESAGVHVDPIVVKAANFEGVTQNMTKSRPGSGNKAKRQVDTADRTAVAVYSLIQELRNVVAANADKVNDAIKELSKVGVKTSFKYDIQIAESAFFDKIDQLHIEDFRIKVPCGLIGEISLTTSEGNYVAEYSSETGIISFCGYDIVSADGMLHVEGKIEGIDENLLSSAFKSVFASNGRASRSDSKKFAFEEEIGVEAGEIVVYDADFKNQDQSPEDMFDSLDAELAFSSSAELEDIIINSVSGSFNYDIDDMHLPDASLTDIPDILQESGTNIRLDNPQIYLYLNNGVIDGAGKAVGASTKLDITAFDNEDHSRDYSLDSAVEVKEPENYIYLSPHAVEDGKLYQGFESAQHVQFSGLGEVLSSVNNEQGGLPTKLAIKTSNTRVSAENVTDLTLGVDYGLSGKYAFVAPLALSQDSRIKYTNTIDGWAESTEGIIIKKLSLSASATTDVPFELQLQAIPINSRGERLMDQAAVLTLPAIAKNAPISLVIEGDIRDLDGIKIDVTAVAKEVRALAPDMNISLSDIKVEVSGNYEAEL